MKCGRRDCGPACKAGRPWTSKTPAKVLKRPVPGLGHEEHSLQFPCRDGNSQRCDGKWPAGVFGDYCRVTLRCQAFAERHHGRPPRTWEVSKVLTSSAVQVPRTDVARVPPLRRLQGHGLRRQGSGLRRPQVQQEDHQRFQRAYSPSGLDADEVQAVRQRLGPLRTQSQGMTLGASSGVRSGDQTASGERNPSISPGSL